MKPIKIILIVFFIFLLFITIAFPLYLVIPFDIPGIAVLILLIVLLLIRHKFTWICGIVLSICGIGYYIFFPALAAWPGALVFTSSLNNLIFGGRTVGFVRTVIALFPLLFYSCLFIMLVSKKGRQYYFR